MGSQSPHSDSLGPVLRRRSLLGLGLLSLTGLPAVAPADEHFPDEFSRETLQAWGRYERKVKDLNGFLVANSFQVPAFSGISHFGISVGGIDAIKDLEEGRGVDPETFAALYAGFALPEVARHLNLKKDIVLGGNMNLRIAAADGRLRYKGTAVRMYSADRLRELFDRRASFRVDDEQKRIAAFTEYAGLRQRSGAKPRSGAGRNQVTDFAERYREMKPILSELESAVRLDVSTSSILPGSTMHIFAMSIGGIDVENDLSTRGAVDPETFAAMLADRVAPEHIDRIKRVEGRLFYDGEEVKLYPMTHLAWCFKNRERLSQKSLRP